MINLIMIINSICHDQSYHDHVLHWHDQSNHNHLFHWSWSILSWSFISSLMINPIMIIYFIGYDQSYHGQLFQRSWSILSWSFIPLVMINPLMVIYSIGHDQSYCGTCNMASSLPLSRTTTTAICSSSNLIVATFTQHLASHPTSGSLLTTSSSLPTHGLFSPRLEGTNDSSSSSSYLHSWCSPHKTSWGISPLAST